jgi:hypothetical protein
MTDPPAIAANAIQLIPTSLVAGGFASAPYAVRRTSATTLAAPRALSRLGRVADVAVCVTLIIWVANLI